ncbi:MAG: hypothetical protein ACRD0X_06345 [Thermoanaerobaculia bacterium]
MGPGRGWWQGVWLHLRFTGLLIGVAAALAVVGYLPTHRRGGAQAIQAMWQAVGLNVVASSLAALPITIARIRPRRESLITVLMGSLALRMVLVAALAVVALLAGQPAERPFLLWVAVGYLVLLPLDTLYAQRHARNF